MAFRKRYLEHGDQAYATGVFLTWDADNGRWIVDSFDGDTYFDGDCIEQVEDCPYITVEVKNPAYSLPCPSCHEEIALSSPDDITTCPFCDHEVRKED